MSETKNYFKELNKVNVSDHIEKKGGLSYVSWTYAWEQAKLYDENANFKVYESMLPDGYQVNYFTDGRTAFVKVGVVINGIEHIVNLPVMDNYNKSIPFEKITSFNVNTAIQRALTKGIAMHGIGLYVYAGEDLPNDDENGEIKPSQTTTKSSENSKVVATQTSQSKEDLVINIITRVNTLSESDRDKLLVWCEGKGYGRDFTTMHESMLGVIDKFLKSKGI